MVFVKSVIVIITLFHVMPILELVQNVYTTLLDQTVANVSLDSMETQQLASRMIVSLVPVLYQLQAITFRQHVVQNQQQNTVIFVLNALKDILEKGVKFVLMAIMVIHSSLEVFVHHVIAVQTQIQPLKDIVTI